MSQNVVVWERREHIALVTLNRPEARNAISPEVSQTMAGILDEIEDDSSLRAVVLTGKGEVFSAGADLKVVASGRANDIASGKGNFAGIVTRDFPKPIIAAVNGPALAGGFEIVLSCDLVVAADTARFGIPEAKRGLMAAAGGLIRLPKRVPLAIALELAMTGDPIDAQRALQLGLVNRVVPAAQVVDEAIALADRIGENSPIAVRNSRQLVREAAELSEAEGWKRTLELMMPVFQSGDAVEGATAFAEKRAPVWKST
ncbi:MAG TPA: crotonase/enoyl-CoA hydratase family protein [Acidimicrobiia bacterium]|jgi:enoyl-CoA hydratase|nr:crotonase/enoyl-CoA hydratase family protein [Acidimicrobiia bacterium]